MSNNRGLDKEDAVHIYHRIEQNEVMPFAATWMDLEIVILSERSQTLKNKHHVTSLIMWNLKK